MIADATGGELFELVPVEPYTDEDLDYTDDSSRVSQEHEDESLRHVELLAKMAGTGQWLEGIRFQSSVSINFQFKYFSGEWICFITAAAEINSYFSVLEKMPQSATQTKTVNWLLYISASCENSLNFMLKL